MTTKKTQAELAELEVAGVSLRPLSFQGAVIWPEWMVPRGMTPKRPPHRGETAITWFKAAPLVPTGVRTEGFLEELIKIADASDKTVLSFAQKWGPTGEYPQEIVVLDPDRKQYLSAEAQKLLADIEAAEEVDTAHGRDIVESTELRCNRMLLRIMVPDGVYVTECYESTESYRIVARIVKAYLSLAIKLGLGRNVTTAPLDTEEEWKTILSPYRAFINELEPRQYRAFAEWMRIIDGYKPGQPVEEQKQRFVLCVSDRLKQATGIEPTFDWNGSQPQTAFRYNMISMCHNTEDVRLNSLAAFQLAAALTSPSGLAHCERPGCEVVYVPQKLRKDRPNYCLACRRIMDSVYQKRSRERAKERAMANPVS